MLSFYHKASRNATRASSRIATGSGRADGQWGAAAPAECGCGSADRSPPHCGLATLAPRTKPPDAAGAARCVVYTAARMNVDRVERAVGRVERIAGRFEGTVRVVRTAENTGGRAVVDADAGGVAGRTRYLAGRIQRSVQGYAPPRCTRGRTGGDHSAIALVAAARAAATDRDTPPALGCRRRAARTPACPPPA